MRLKNKSFPVMMKRYISSTILIRLLIFYFSITGARAYCTPKTYAVGEVGRRVNFHVCKRPSGREITINGATLAEGESGTANATGWSWRVQTLEERDVFNLSYTIQSPDIYEEPIMVTVHFLHDGNEEVSLNISLEVLKPGPPTVKGGIPPLLVLSGELGRAITHHLDILNPDVSRTFDLKLEQDVAPESGSALRVTQYPYQDGLLVSVEIWAERVTVENLGFYLVTIANSHGELSFQMQVSAYGPPAFCSSKQGEKVDAKVGVRLEVNICIMALEGHAAVIHSISPPSGPNAKYEASLTRRHKQSMRYEFLLVLEQVKPEDLGIWTIELRDEQLEEFAPMDIFSFNLRVVDKAYTEKTPSLLVLLLAVQSVLALLVVICLICCIKRGRRQAKKESQQKQPLYSAKEAEAAEESEEKETLPETME